MSDCRLCKASNVKTIYRIENIPVFQNRVYGSESEARKTLTGDIDLAQCQDCGFVFNQEFNQSLVRYDGDYENEQAHSNYFRLYIREIIELFKTIYGRSNKIIEIGCGKGFFLDQMRQAGFDMTGFDPAYDGDNPHIIKDYFSEKYKKIRADTIVLRHTLEHIDKPFEFIHKIAKSNGYAGKIFIEVPCFDWIMNKKAFWDIYYEHCNYFTMQTLRSMFNASQTGKHFKDQYLHLLTDLNDLKSFVKSDQKPNLLKKIPFINELDRYKRFVSGKKGVFVWGAGAKGVTFVGLTDSHKQFIKGLVDINPKKQNHYIAKTGHKICGTNILENKEVKNILVMNENYLKEIEKMISKPGIRLFALGEL